MIGNQTHGISGHMFVASAIALLITFICGVLPASRAHCADAPAAVTTAKPTVSPDNLKWLVKPLTLPELVVEANAWQNLLKAKVKQIGDSMIASRSLSAEIEEEQEAASTNATEAAAAREQIEARKTQVLEGLNTLREERDALIANLRVVLAELTAKGGEAQPYSRYIDSVSEVPLDVSDTSALWTYISGWVTSEQGGIKWLVNTTKFVVILVIFIFLSKLLGKAVEKATGAAKRMSELLRQFINTMVRRAIIAIGLLIGLSVLGLPIGPLLAVITAAGFVIGLALQGTLSNFASGLLLLFYRPFDVGDAVEAGGVAGTVSAMNLMSTQIKTWDNKTMIVPNNSIWGSVITNISRIDQRRVDMVFGISYGDSMEKAQGILEKIVAEHPKVLKEPAPVVKVHQLGDSSVNFVVRPWVLPGDYWAVYWDVTRKVKEQFDAQGVSIPFPQRDVHLYQEKA